MTEENEITNEKYGVCGVYCGLCPSGKGKIKNLAEELRKYIVDDYQWVESVVKEFDYANFLKGLEWFTNQQCPSCTKIEEPWCDVRKCEKIITKKIESCLLCEVFLNCPRTDYQRKRYPFVIDHYHRVKMVGFKRYLEEEEERTKNGVSLTDIRAY
jgi:hypothetical protein